MQACALKSKLVPVRMVFQDRKKNLRESLAAFIERTQIDVPAGGDNFQRRADGSNIPARISFRVLGASYGNTAGCGVTQLGHKADCREASRIAPPNGAG